MKNLSILILERFFGLGFLWESRQSINYSISFFLLIINSKVKLKELSSLSYLIKAQIFDIYKLIEVIIISRDKFLYLVSFK